MTEPSQQHDRTSVDAARTEVQAYPRPYGDRYVLLSELGKGGMGQVFMAVTGGKEVERVCALKIIRRLDPGGQVEQSANSEEMGKRFLDEAKVVTKLSHENLVYVFDFGLVRGSPSSGDATGSAYIAMEYLRGKTLTELWNRCALRKVGVPMGVALFIVAELAAGLAYAHGLSGYELVHRDVSPSNIMLTYTGGVKLIDFGLAKWSAKAAQTITGVNWGKVSYMSPEQHMGHAIDHRSDIYSLGVILWELLTGRQLFPTEQIRRSTLSIAPASQFNPSITPELDQVIMKALAGDAENRFQGAADFGQALLRHMPREASKQEVAQFLTRLFEIDARTEADEEQRLLARAADQQNEPKAQSKGGAEGETEAHNPEGDPLIGVVLAGRYYVKRKIGEGSMGAVYEGHHTGIGKRVAIKVPHHAERRKEKLLQRFRMEANAASQIGHANIADVTDCGTTASGDFFFVMEYVDGIDLSKVIRRSGPMALERSLLIAIQICRALEAAHRAGIIHRDLKPSNVMLVRDREDNEVVKVLDFGVAKFLRSDAAGGAELTMADAAVGTPRYMAPEQIESGKTVDFRIDTYAIGGTLYAMLSGGHAPFESESVHEVWRRKTSEDPPSIARHRSDLPDALVALIMGCLARVPEKRPQSVEVLKQGLLKVLEDIRHAGSSVLAMRVPSETSQIDHAPKRTSSGKRMPIAYAAGGAGLVLAGFVAWSISTKPQPTKTPTPLTNIGAVPAQVAPGITTPAPPTTPPIAPPPATPPAAAASIAPLAAPKAAPTRVPSSPLPSPAAAPKAKVLAPPTSTHPTHGPVPVSPSITTSEGSEKKASSSSTKPPTSSANNDALLQEVELAFRRGQLVQATVLAQKAIAQKPTVMGYLLLGKTYLFRDDPGKAAAAYQEALRLEPGNARAAQGLAQARSKMQR